MPDSWFDDNIERLTISQTAQRFGTTTSTINRWIREKRLDALRVDGTWYVLLPRDSQASQASDGQHTVGQDALVTISSLRAEIQFLRQELANRSEELRRKDYIIAALLSTLISDNVSETGQSSSGTRPGAERAWHQDGPKRDALCSGSR